MALWGFVDHPLDGKRPLEGSHGSTQPLSGVEQQGVSIAIIVKTHGFITIIITIII